jgi:hypothetical protein
MNLSALFTANISRYIKADKIAVLNLSKNNLGDTGVNLLMRTVV